MSIIINNKFAIKNTIGSGMFGVVYEGINMRTKEQIAMKLEKETNRNKLIRREAMILNYLNRNEAENVPGLYYYGIIDDLSCIIMPKFSCDLLEYIENKNPDLENLMIHCVHCVKSIHDKNVLHRDIKPQNFMIKNGKVYLIDFGFSIFFKDENGVHAKKQEQHIIGSVKYNSFFNHCGEPCSRRDDLLSIGYMFLSFVKELPWSNVPEFKSDLEITSIDHPRNLYIKQQKCYNIIESYIPEVWKSYFENVYNLKYDSIPIYTST
jgi:serine/threonine protein kinase